MSNGEKILIVDDEEKIVQVMKILLAREGYSVDSAMNTAEAESLLHENQYNLMLTDLKFNNDSKDGLDIATDARTMDPFMSIVIMTAYADVETSLNAMKAGVFDYISKPFKLDDLMELTKRALEYNRQLKEKGKVDSALENTKGKALRSFLKDKERQNVQLVLDQCDGDEEKAAQTLNIPVSALRKKLAGDR